MKILIVNRYFSEILAVEALAWDTFSFLKKQGHDVYFFATDKKPYFIKNYKYSKYFSKDKYSMKEYIKNPINSYYWDFDAEHKLEQMLKDIKPDIIHVNQNITMSIFKVIKKYKIPVIWTLHDPSIACPASTLKMGNGKICTNFYCKNGKFYNCLKYKCQNNSIEPSIRKTFRSYFNKYVNLYKDVDLYIAPSKALKELVITADLGIEPDKIIVLNNFIKQRNEKLNKELNKNNYFLFVGRIVEEKGIKCLLEAIKGLSRDIPFKIAGSGNLDNYLKKYVEDHKLTNVEILGFIENKNLDELYQNAIATIVPSNFFEIFGLVNIESFLNKTPVIGSYIGAIPEIIDDGINGFVFEVGNVEMLKEKILLYWNNLEMSKLHGENGYQKTIKNYVIDKYMSNLLTIYEKLVLKKVGIHEN